MSFSLPLGVPALEALAIVLASVVGMEFAAAALHRHVMHGPGWGWHRSHHEPQLPLAQRGFAFERNDLYALVFAAVSASLMWVGQHVVAQLFWVGIGMAVYGVLYAAVHDGFVHQRGPFKLPVPRRGYLARLVQAHRLHHATRTRDGAVSFGFLSAPPPRVLAAALRAQRHAPSSHARALQRTHMHVHAQSRRGLGLAALIVAAWSTLLGAALFVDVDGAWAVPAAIATIALLCWLDVGLFIVAHDAMHGTLARAWPGVNRAVGRIALVLYAGFSFDRFASRHHHHHRTPGADGDPDFHRDARFWPWYAAFLRRYVGWRELAGLVVVSLLLMMLAPPWRVALFWTLPALLASLQLFAFGTWLPHRPRADDPFADRHRARSNRYGTLASLASCFHFGYHLEHHRRPDAPWWRLPAIYRESRQPTQGRVHNP
jgi:beta-carotene/zeaxanthin 4-ketolase